MEKRVSSRAIIINDNKLLTMYRRKLLSDGTYKEYNVIPGGGVEEGETLEDTVIRELKEEMCVDIKVLNYLGYREDEKSIEHYYKCEIVSGELKVGGEESKKNSETNYYEIKYIDIDKLEDYDVYGIECIKKANVM